MYKGWAANGDEVASIPLGGVAQVKSGGFRSLFNEVHASTGPATHAGTLVESEEDVLEQARIEAFAMGFDEGCRVTGESASADADARQRLADALEMLTPAPNGALAAMLSATVIRLVSQIVGEVEIDAHLLQQRCEAVAAFIDENEGKSALYLHPDDLPLVEESHVGVKLVADPSMNRGCVRLDTHDGWIEDGPDVRLARLRAMMDDMEGRS